MAEAATIARPYAKAAFAWARDSNALAAWSEALRAGAELAGAPGISAMIGDPGTDISRIVAVFADLSGLQAAGHAGGDVDAHWQNFVRLLAENKRLDILADIRVQYEELRAQYENEVDVQVTSAVALSEAQRAKLAAALKTRFKRDVRMTTAIDPALLGGAVIRTGDLVIDGSINGRLQRLASALVN